MFDLKLVENFYNKINSKIQYIKEKINRPLTLSEKILYQIKFYVNLNKYNLILVFLNLTTFDYF